MADPLETDLKFDEIPLNSPLDFLENDWPHYDRPYAVPNYAEFPSLAPSLGTTVPNQLWMQGPPVQPVPAFTPNAISLGYQSTGLPASWTQQPAQPPPATARFGRNHNPTSFEAPIHGGYEPFPPVQALQHPSVNHATAPLPSVPTPGPSFTAPTMGLDNHILGMHAQLPQQGFILGTADMETANLLPQTTTTAVHPVQGVLHGPPMPPTPSYTEQVRVSPMHHSPAESFSRQRQQETNGGMFAKCLVKTFVDPDTGVMQGQQAVYGQPRNRRGRMTEENRASRQLTKQVGGACVQCKDRKRKCSIGEARRYDPCPECFNAKPRLLRSACCRLKVTEATFFRQGPMPQSPFDSTSRSEVFLVQDIQTQGRDSRMLELTQDVGGLKLTVTVSRFTPRDTDKTALTWTDKQGKNHSHEMAPYCLDNVNQIVVNMWNYALRARRPYIISILANANPIARKIVDEAEKFIAMNKNTLLEEAMRLWILSRLIERGWRICGSETLDMDPICDETSPDYHIIPVTPVMDTQLDQIVIRKILNPLVERIRRKLQERLEKLNRNEWFENFLTIFILLSSIEACSVHGEKFARDFGLGRRYADPNEFEGYFHGCRTLLSHYHFVLQGHTPLTIDWRSQQADKLATLTGEQKDFLEDIKPMLAKEEANLRRLKKTHRYAAHLYWTHQMFYPDWTPGDMHTLQEIIPDTPVPVLDTVSVNV